MAIYSFKNISPQVAQDCFIAPGAHLIGNLVLGQKVSIWHNSVLRGDVQQIKIGDNTNVQDLSMLHVTEKNPLIIKENVTIGHSVTLHGCTIHKNSMIGMGATVLDDVIINEFSIVAAGSVVPPGKEYPAFSMIMGSPAKVTRKLRDDEVGMLKQHYRNYLKYAEEFKESVLELL